MRVHDSKDTCFSAAMDLSLAGVMGVGKRLKRMNLRGITAEAEPEGRGEDGDERTKVTKKTKGGGAETETSVAQAHDI